MPPKRRPRPLGLKLNLPGKYGNKNENINELSRQTKKLEISRQKLFNVVDKMPETTNEEIAKKYGAAFDILLIQYEKTHKDIMEYPMFKTLDEKLKAVKDMLLNLKNTKTTLDEDGNKLKNTFNNGGNADQGRRLKLEKEYVVPNNPHSKLHPDEVLVLFDVQVYKNCVENECHIKKVITPRDMLDKHQRYYTMFKVIFEIAMQELARETIEKENIKIPEIYKYYLVINENKEPKFVIEMEYIENKDLQNKEQLLQAYDALKKLRDDYKIYHNDSHRENIRYQPKTGKIVLFDWDTASIGESKTQEPSPSGISIKREMIDDEYFKDWVSGQIIPLFTTLGGGKTKTRKNKTRKNKTRKTKTRKNKIRKTKN